MMCTTLIDFNTRRRCLAYFYVPWFVVSPFSGSWLIASRPHLRRVHGYMVIVGFTGADPVLTVRYGTRLYPHRYGSLVMTC